MRLIAARLARHAGDHAAAREQLLALQTVPNLPAALKRDIEFELGWCADGLGDTDAAFRFFSAAKSQAEALAAPSAELKAIYPRQLEGLMQLYGGPAAPIQLPSIAAQKLPAFLLGFPRSGTTLLDTMLDAHGGFTVMEEQPSIQAMLDAYLAAGLSYPWGLPDLTLETERGMREAYFSVCRGAGWDASRPLLDGRPSLPRMWGCCSASSSVRLSVPLFARHPCDVVLSCFMNNFQFNSGTVRRQWARPTA